MYTNVQIRTFCKLMIDTHPRKFVSAKLDLDSLKLAREFIWQHALEGNADLLPLVVNDVDDWLEQWEGRKKFLTNLKNKHESQGCKGIENKTDARKNW